MDSRFKKGDRVRSITNTFTPVGLTGKVIREMNSETFGVEFDSDCGGHSCGGDACDNRGWWVNYSDIELIDVHTTPEEVDIPNKMVGSIAQR